MKPLKTYEAAKKLDITQRTLRRLLNEEKLHGYKIGGRWRVDSDEICAQMKNKCTKTVIHR